MSDRQNFIKSRMNHSMHREKYFSHPMLWLCVRDILHKETRAVKLVFLQRVKEVTTDGADAARQPTRHSILIHYILSV